MPQLCTKGDHSLKDSLRQFLSAQSNAQLNLEYCGCCGSVCMHLPLNVWLEGDEQALTIWLPFCPDCNPELFARMPAVA